MLAISIYFLPEIIIKWKGRVHRHRLNFSSLESVEKYLYWKYSLFLLTKTFWLNSVPLLAIAEHSRIANQIVVGSTLKPVIVSVYCVVLCCIVV